ncbi:MAG: hypothetical protein IPO29_16645 [Anaerolineae bacterium]|nr:hypothetical protein [Anaerolineae bacterium]
MAGEIIRPTQPSIVLRAPGAGDVALPGAVVALKADLTAPPGGALDGGCAWSVTVLDGLMSRLIEPTSSGDGASFVMPVDLGPGARVEAACYAKAASGATAVARATVRRPDEDGYIRNWLLSRSFQGKTLNDNVWPGGEAAFGPKPGDPALWRITSPTRYVALDQTLSPGENAVAYAFVWVDSPEDRGGLLGMLSDDGIAAWLNGKEIWRNKVSRAVPADGPEALRDLDLPKIELKKGLNGLLLKVDQTRGEWRFKARILNPDGSIMRDVGLTTGMP